MVKVKPTGRFSLGKLKAHPRNQEASAALKSLSRERPRSKKAKSAYDNFNQLNGTHPWQKVMPEGQISYKVRKLKNGKVAYFNYNLAKEMGLVRIIYLRGNISLAFD